MKAGNGIVKIIGDVTPYAGVGECKVSISFSDDTGEQEYIVLPRGAGVDLVDHLSASVEAEGTLSQGSEGENYIQVRSYRFLDADDMWYEDE